MLLDTLKKDLTTSLKAGEGLKVSVLRMLLSEINYKKIDLQRDLTDEDIYSVLQKEVKKRKEAIEAYSAAGRVEQAWTETQELEILGVYMPKLLSEEEIQKEILAVIDELKTQEFSAVMKVIAPKLRGRADGKLVAELVKKQLQP